MGSRTAKRAALIGSVAYGGGVPLPSTLAGIGNLVGSWDFGNGASLTMTPGAGGPGGGGEITSIAGSNGTSVTVTKGAGGGPLSVIRNGVMAAKFTNAQYMQVVNDLGLSAAGQATLVAVMEPTILTANLTVGSISLPSATFQNKRYTLGFAASGAGPQMIRAGNANDRSLITLGSGSVRRYLIIGRSASGTVNATLNVDGVGTALVAAATSANPTGLTTTTIGGDPQSSALTSLMQGYVFAFHVFKSALSDADAEAIAVAFAASSYKTTNNA